MSAQKTDQKLTPSTLLKHVGKPAAPGARPVNPPVVRASTVLFDSLQDLREASSRPFSGLYYGRFGTPTHEALAAALNQLAGAAGSVFYPSGLAAIAGALLSLVEAGDEILVADCVYGPTRNFCTQDLARLGVKTRFFPATEGAQIAQRISAQTRLIFCESPGSLTMELQDLPAICAAANARGVPVLVDNTWATPLHAPVLDMGAAVDIQAGTKYLTGHADVMLGAAMCRDDVLERVRQRSQSLGYCVSADDAYLALRGLRTLDVRLRAHAENARVLKQWMRAQPEVLRILDPADAQHPQHALWQRDFRGANGLFSVEFKPLSDAQLSAFTDTLKLFGLGYSWGGYESLCLPFDVASQREDSVWKSAGTCVRFHAGLEDPQDLLNDLDAAIAALRRA